MELRSTGNPDTRNYVTMSMLEYLRKKGRETMNEKTLQSEDDNYKKKHKVKSAEIVVRKTDKKPYYEIKYFDLSDNEYHIGYGSYKLEYVFEWLEQCFEIVEKNTNADKIRNMTDEELAKFIESVQCYGHGWCEKCSSLNGDYCKGIRVNEPDADILDWLKQPVEE